MGLIFSSQPGVPNASSIDTLTDEEVQALIEKRREEDRLGPKGKGSPVWRISQDAVAKSIQTPTEIFMMKYVSAHTAIPIPSIRRVLLPQRQALSLEAKGWLVMDYIDGDSLKVAWPTMSLWMRLKTIWAFWGYIRQLRRVPLLNPGVPGPFDDTGVAYTCRGPWFTPEGAGPFSTYAEMADWYDQRRFDGFVAHFRRTQSVSGFRISKFDRSQPLVLCHMDLHRGNLIVERGTGKLWVIDWAFAGAYPAWLDYCVALNLSFQRPNDRPMDLWDWSVRFIIGNYEKYRTCFIKPLTPILAAQDRDPEPPNYLEERGLVIEGDKLKYVESSRTN